jgi:hypothetical protein
MPSRCFNATPTHAAEMYWTTIRTHVNLALKGDDEASFVAGVDLPVDAGMTAI